VGLGLGLNFNAKKINVRWKARSWNHAYVGGHAWAWSNERKNREKAREGFFGV
jgi:hypothetical protein